MSRTNPVFYRRQLELECRDEPERLDRILHDPDSVELLTWNIFMSLDTHTDREWLAYRLQAFGGTTVQAPTKLAVWTGRRREPLLRPAPGFVAAARSRAEEAGGDDAATTTLERPVEVAARIESPQVLTLVEALWAHYPEGTGGRDRLVELIDAGLEHARGLSKQLAVAVLYDGSVDFAGVLSRRVNALRDAGALATALPHRDRVPRVLLREVTWQQLARIWDAERKAKRGGFGPFTLRYLDLSGEPTTAFARLLERRGLLRDP